MSLFFELSIPHWVHGWYGRMAAVATVLSFIAGCFVLRLVVNGFHPALRHYPGPWMARFTDFWRLWEVYMQRQPPTLIALHKKYGAAVRIGPNIIDISDPAIIEPVCGAKGNFVKSDMMKVWQVVKDGKRTEFITDAQDKGIHAKLKRPVASTYSLSNLCLSEPIMDDTIRYFIRRLDERFVRRGLVCNIHDWVQYFAFDVIGELTFSNRFGFLEAGKDVHGILSSLQNEFDYRAIIGQMPWLDNLLKKNPLYLRFIQPTNPIATLSARLLEARSKASLDSKRRDLYDGFIEAQNAHPEISDTTVMRYAMNTIVAGADTTAVIIRSILYHTLRNPSVVTRLQRELDSARLSYPADFRKVRCLPYLDATIREGLRLHPAPGFSLERIVDQHGLELPDGRWLPGGCLVALNQWAMHLHPTFGQDGETFRPERWLRGDESEDEFRRRLAAMKRADFSFSYGPRMCLGRHVAQMEIYKTIATLFGVFNLNLVSEKAWKVEYGFTARQLDMDIKIRWRDGLDLSSLFTEL